MIFIVIADNKEFRSAKVAEVLEPLGESDVIVLDDTATTLADLEQYLYPSLFTFEPPVIHGKYLISSYKDAGAPLIKKLLASPTIFIFEEIALPAGSLSTFKKAGAVVHEPPKEKSIAKKNDLFATVSSIVTLDKKNRWS